MKEALLGGNDDLHLMHEIQEVEWREESFHTDNIRSVMDQIQREVLWELYEINFRCDLLAVDMQLASSKWFVSDSGDSDALDRTLQMNECFEGGKDLDFMLLPPKITKQNAGLASDKVSDSVPYLIALARIVIDWSIPLDPIIEEHGKISGNTPVSDIKAFKLTRALADAYCAGVYRVLGRAAVTPRRIQNVRK